MGSRLAGVEVHLPQRCLGRAEVEAPVALVGPARGVSLGLGVVEL
jgi:hypothetical protein